MHNRDSSAAGLLTFFAGRFDMATATSEDLAYLADAGEYASHEALSLSEKVRGIAELIDVSESHAQTPGIVCPSNGGQQQLLWKIAREVELIGRLIEISGEADYELRQRARRPAPKAKTPKATASGASA